MSGGHASCSLDTNEQDARITQMNWDDYWNNDKIWNTFGKNYFN
ncbi:MAG: hypothetical protein AAF630_17195 [Cyanobacteria bacterium P01_C01_bin.38]